MNQSEIHIAWAAGILEGEACFDIRKSECVKRDPENKHARLMIVMTDLDVLETLQYIFGGTIRANNAPSAKRKSHWKQSYRWLLSERQSLLNCLNHVKPFLHKRRSERCDEMLEFLNRKLNENR
jgi:hypothetical protein